MGVNGSFSKPAKLQKGQSLDGFACGVDAVDEWASRHARHAEERGTAVPYVSYCGGIVAGFYTLSPYSIARADVGGGWLRRNVPVQIPVILLGMLGVDKRFQGRGLGSQLLKDAVLRASLAADVVGGRALVVEPANEAASAFYGQYGFKPIPGTSMMYIPLAR